MAWEFFKANFPRIQEFAGGGNAWTLQSVIVCCSYGFGSERAAADIEEFFIQHPVPNAARKISQQCEKIHVAAGFVEKIRKSTLMEVSSFAFDL